MKYIVLLWISVIMIVLCLLFLPYGYSTASKISNVPRTYVIDKNWNNVVKSKKVEWIYAKHNFILYKPSSYIQPSDHIVEIVENNKILWHIVFIELSIVLVIMGSVILTFILYDDRKTNLSN